MLLAAACCGVCWRRKLRCCLLRWVHAKTAALLLAAVGACEGGCTVLLAAVGACEDGCAAACCGGCWCNRLLCCLLRLMLAKEAALLLAVGGAGEAGCSAAFCG